MWLLSSDSAVLGGKRLWLRPGSQHVLGRTSSKTAGPERYQFVDHKSVSRKHLILSVADVSPDDSGDASARHVIKATDSSKTGSAIDGSSKFRGESRSLNGNRHIVQLGSWDKTFILEWLPVVLSYKLKPAILTVEREKLESTGVKLLVEYVGLTTHVVAKVRNTAAGLLGLVQARWLVTPEFVDALAAACKRDGLDGDGQQRVSPLEQDFDANWPKEEDHLVPTAGEPVKRPADWLKPDTTRCTVFTDYTFLLFSAKQRDSLSPVIQAGGGKALAYNFEKGRTTTDQVVEYIQNIAGQKDNTNFSLGHDEGPGGIVVVRAEAKDASRDNEFMAGIDTALNQRSVEQNELLDVILENNASVLCRPLRLSTQTVAPTQHGEDRRAASEIASYNGTRNGVDGNNTAQDAPTTQRSTAAAQIQEHDPAPPTKHDNSASLDGMSALQRIKARRAIKQKELKDEFDPSLVVRAPSNSPEPSMRATSEAPSTQHRDYDDSQMGYDEPSQMRHDEPSQRRSGTQPSTRKRPGPPPDMADETNEQMMDRLMPGAASYKRRKMQAPKDGQSSLADAKPKDQAPETAEAEKSKGKGKSKVKPENDLQAQMRAQREKEDEERRKDEESMREMRNVDVSTIKIDHNVEVFDLPVRPPREATTETGEGRGDRWNPAWNGRPNFKKFRPKRNKQGDAGAGRATAEAESQRVVIALEEIPGRGHGLGDEYWLEPSRDKGKKKKKKSQTQTQTQSQRGRTSAAAAGDSDDDQLSFRRRLQQSREDDADAALADEFFEEAATSQSTLGRTQQKKTARTSAAAKRPATTQAAGGPPAKKARQTTATQQTTARTATTRKAATRIEDSDEDDDDPLAFKRR